MTRTYQIPIPPRGQTPLTFPLRCICCGAPKQTESTLLLNRLVMRGSRQQHIELKYLIPHCERCARGDKAVFLAGFLPFALGFILLGGLSFIAVAFFAGAAGLDNSGQPGNANSLVLGAAVGLLVGLIGGFLFELVARILLLPFFGQALFRAPLLAAQLLQDFDYVAGLMAKPDQQSQNVSLTFFNDEIAREFAVLNGVAGDTRQ